MEHTSTQRAWETHHGEVYSYLQKKLGSEAVAKDVLQDVFVQVHTKAHTLKDPSRLTGWIFTIARNKATEHFRQVKRQEKLGTLEETDMTVDLSHRLISCLPTFIGQLKEPYQSTLQAIDLEGKSQKELAEELGLSHSAIKSRVQRARKKLEEKIRACCHVSTDRYGHVFDIEQNQGC